LLLAIPVVSFGAISARDQLARLESGRIAPEKFDWSALRFDFGPAGRRAVDRLARSSSEPRIRRLAARVAGQNTRWETVEAVQAAERAARPRNVHVVPAQIPLPKPLEDLLFAEGRPMGDRGPCNDNPECLLYWRPGDSRAIALIDPCYVQPGTRGPAIVVVGCGWDVRLYEQAGSAWRRVPEFRGREAPFVGVAADRREEAARRAAALAGQIEIRPVAARQVFIAGKPIGRPFE
jgi:hypothetical protein